MVLELVQRLCSSAYDALQICLWYNMVMLKNARKHLMLPLTCTKLTEVDRLELGVWVNASFPKKIPRRVFICFVNTVLVSVCGAFRTVSDTLVFICNGMLFRIHRRCCKQKTLLFTNWRRRRISATCGSRLTTGLFLIFRARSAYRNVPSVSSVLLSAGLIQAIISVWLLPPSESKHTDRHTYIHRRIADRQVDWYTDSGLPVTHSWLVTVKSRKIINVL